MPGRGAHDLGHDLGYDLGYDLGVDLGTTYTAAAVLPVGPGGGRGPRPVGLEPASVQTPSVLLFDGDDPVRLGAEAEALAPSRPHRVVREFKRRLGDETPIVVAGRAHAADDVAASLVRWVVDRVATRCGGPARAVTVAHPAGWGAYRHRVFRTALAAAGVAGAGLVTEPEAALRAHAAAGRIGPGRTVAVYDLGGGTLDAAVVRGRPGGGVDLLGRAQGLESLGGIDFDEALFWHVCGELGGVVAALDPADPEVARAVAGLRRACVAAKETLSFDTEVAVPVELPGLSTRVRVTRGEFEDLIGPAVHRTLDVLGEVLDTARVDAGAVDEVLLVGGSSRIPLVSRVLFGELGRPVVVDPDPDTVVARGAAISGVRAPAIRTVRPDPHTPRRLAAARRAAHLPAPARPGAAVLTPPRAVPAPRPTPAPSPPRPVAAPVPAPRDEDDATDTLRVPPPAPRPIRPPVRSVDPAPAAVARRSPRRRRWLIGGGVAVTLAAGVVVATTVPLVRSAPAPAAPAATGTPAATTAPAAAPTRGPGG